MMLRLLRAVARLAVRWGPRVRWIRIEVLREASKGGLLAKDFWEIS